MKEHELRQNILISNIYINPYMTRYMNIIRDDSNPFRRLNNHAKESKVLSEGKHAVLAIVMEIQVIK